MTAVDVMPDMGVDWGEAELDTLAPAEILPLEEWAEQYRVITAGPVVGPAGEPVGWSNSLDPLGVAVMQAFDDPRWSSVCFMGSPQRSGKTELVVNLILSTIHQRRASVLYHNASAVVALDVWNKKIEPAVRKSDDLAHLLSNDREEVGVKERRDFMNGASLLLRGSESRAALASASTPVTIGDDVQAMRTFPEGDHPADLAMERTDAFAPRELRNIHLGQPGVIGDWLSEELFGSAFYVPFVPCLACGIYQAVEWDRMVYDTEDPREATNNTWMRCANRQCDHEITDRDLPAMLARYRWVSTPPETNWVTDPMAGGTWVDLSASAVYPETDRKTTTCGFWRPAFYWPFVKWGSLAVQAAKAEGKPDKEINFQKRIKGVPYEEPGIDEDALSPDDVKARALTSHHWKIVPVEAGVHEGKGVVIVTSDVQAGYVWYLVWAWHLATATAWLVECGRIGKRIDPKEFPDKRERKQAWRAGISRALEKLWVKESQGWPVIRPGGELVATVKATRCLIDCGFEREEVQLACKRFNGGRWKGKWLPVEGSQAFAKSRVPVWPGINKGTIEKKTRRRYWEINTNRGKLYGRNLFAVPPGEPGALNLPADMPAKMREWFAAHMCAEEWDDGKGKWVKVSGENHLLDCAAEQIAGAICCEVKAKWSEKRPDDEDTETKPKHRRVPQRRRLLTPAGEPFLVTERGY